jgi:NAD(P)-dependent dehydrogenase (short-subunit alcohol dehydrogenase family)
MVISGKVFIVTGGASGLGAATARLIVKRGGRVLVADVNPAGDSIAKELGANALFVQTDVTQVTDGARAVAAATEKFGALHGLVNCAGIGPAELVAGRNGPHRLESFTRVITVNLIGTFNMIRLAATAIQKNDPLADGERGVIVNTASVAAFEGQIGQAAYSASKGGIVGMTLPIARELARFGIRVVTIAPGLFLTPLLAGLPQQVQASLAQAVPFPARLGNAEEYAALVASICEINMLNGETIRLDGALRMSPK